MDNCNRVGATITRTSQRSVFDPKRGNLLYETYVGQHQALISLADALSRSGIVCEVTQEAGHATMSAQWGDQNDPAQVETPNDRWEISTDYYEESIWNNPLVWAAAGGSGDTIADWKDRIKTLLEASSNGGPVPLSNTGFTGMLAEIYLRALSDEMTYNIERVSLSRVRTFSIRYADRVQLEATQKVYSTATLISTFSVPSVIASKLPSTPAGAPQGTAFGWKKRQDRSVYTYGGKVEESRDWVFAPYSILLHTWAS